MLLFARVRGLRNSELLSITPMYLLRKLLWNVMLSIFDLCFEPHFGNHLGTIGKNYRSSKKKTFHQHLFRIFLNDRDPCSSRIGFRIQRPLHLDRFGLANRSSDAENICSSLSSGGNVSMKPWQHFPNMSCFQYLKQRCIYNRYLLYTVYDYKCTNRLIDCTSM